MFCRHDILSRKVISGVLVLAAAVSFLALTVSRSLGSPTEDTRTQKDNATLGMAGIVQSDTATRAQILEGRLPLSFEANHGQSDRQVDFIARGRGYTIFLTPRQAVLTLRGPDTLTEGRGQGQARAVVLRQRLVGANGQPQVVGLEKLPGTVNYVQGNDPVQWRTNIPTYAKVRYDEVYPGIDAVYYGNQRRLEYDFIVEPGANPENIVLAFEGAERVAVDREGDLLLHVDGGTIRHQKPAVYQDVDGGRREIAGGYVLKGAREVGFTLAAYDKSRPLVIDPVLFYSSYVGGTDDDNGDAIATDSDGNVYITGGAESIDFPTSPGAFQAAPGGLKDAFVIKLDPAGSVVYSTYLGGVGDDVGRAIAADGTGNAHITGEVESTNFPTTVGAFRTTLSGVRDAFVAKLDTVGWVVYSTYLGGTGEEEPSGLAVDTSGNAYVTGETASIDFPTTAGAFRTASAGLMDAFITKLDPAGVSLVYSTYLGGTGDDDTRGIAIDADRNAYVTGETLSTNFPTTLGAFQRTMAGVSDAFVAKLDPAGAVLVYATYLGGRGADRGFDIALDPVPNPNAYVAGRTASTNFPVSAGAFQTILAGTGVRLDAFVTKINPTGSLVYSTYIGGGGGDEEARSIGVDGSGYAYVTGETVATNFPTTADAFRRSLAGRSDAFVTKLNPAGSALAYSTYLGGGGEDDGRGLAVDPVGSIYVTGQTSSTDFPTTAGAADTTFNGTADVFVTKIAGFGPSASLTVAPTAATTTVNTQSCVTATARDAAGNAVVGVTVRVAVTGAHSASSAAKTDASGQALFCYTGVTAGNDTITAYADTNQSGTQGPGEPGGTATKTWTSP
jgi:hypothetical protein